MTEMFHLKNDFLQPCRAMAAGFLNQGQLNDALSLWGLLRDWNNNDAEAWAMMGTVYARAGDAHHAERCFEHALRLQPENAQYRSHHETLRQRTGNTAPVAATAGSASRVSNRDVRVEISDAERLARHPHETTVQAARRIFEEYGVLHVANAFDAALIDRMAQAYRGEYELREESFGSRRNQQVGGGRFMVTLEFKPPFSETDVYANPFVLPMIKALLSDDCRINSFVAVTAHSGAANQHVHVDLPWLFLEREKKEMGELTRALPPYVLTLVIPLVDTNPLTGTTRVWPGSQRMSTPPKPVGTALFESVAVFPQKGDCFMFDGRLLHHGTANYSGYTRPILYLGYARPWFHDGNHSKQIPIVMSETQYASIDAGNRNLFPRAFVGK